MSKSKQVIFAVICALFITIAFSLISKNNQDYRKPSPTPTKSKTIINDDDSSTPTPTLKYEMKTFEELIKNFLSARSFYGEEKSFIYDFIEKNGVYAKDIDRTQQEWNGKEITNIIVNDVRLEDDLYLVGCSFKIDNIDKSTIFKVKEENNKLIIIGEG